MDTLKQQMEMDMELRVGEVANLKIPDPNIKTTSIYIHVQDQRVLKIVSPLDRIIEDSTND